MVIKTLIVLTMLGAAQDASVQVQSGNKPYWSGDEGWHVYSYPDEGMCDIGFPTASGEYVTIGFSPKEEITNLLVTNKHATSLKKGDMRRLSVAFASAAGQPFISLHTLSFEIVEIDNGRGFSAVGTYPGFLDDIEKSGVMGVFTQTHTVVAAISLKGSAEAVKQLRNCAYAAAQLDSKDPFLQKP